ncbi:MAG: VWA domain-containing protein, partial [bacterium]
KDFVVKYKLAGDLINSGLLLSRGEGKDAENFFLLTVQPPKRIDPAYIPPREYVFVLDVSGSMNGFPSVMAKKTILNLLDKLDKDDKFNLILFASGFDVFSENLVTANRDNLEKAFKFMAESRQGGGTELLPALEKALKMPKDSKASRSVVVITDGLIDFESKAFELIRNNLNKANVFAFGIGTSMNKLTIEGIARAGNGLYFEANRLDDAEYQSERFVKYIATPILTDIKVTYDGFGVSEVEPMSVPDLFPDRPIIIYGKWDGNLQGGIKIEAINGQEKISVELPITKFGEMVEGDALKQLWARKQIELLSDYQSFGERDKYKKEITDLGLKYSLMTAYTSFIAVDNEIVPNIDKEGNNNPQSFQIRNSRANDTQVKVDGQSISNAFVGGMGSSGVQSSGSGLIKKADISSNKGQDPNAAIDLNYSDEPNFIEKIIHSFYAWKNHYISYDIKEFDKNIYQAQKELNYYGEGRAYLSVKVDRNGQVVKITPKDTNKILNEIAIRATNRTKFKPAQKNWKKIDQWIEIYSYITLPEETFDYNFQGRTYKMSFIESNNIKYRFTKMEDGIGEKVKSIDKVRFAYSLYNEQQQILESDTINVFCGIGEVIIVLEEALKNMHLGEQQLIIFDYDTRYYYSDKPYLSFKKFPYNNKYFIKIKVLEVNPK